MSSRIKRLFASLMAMIMVFSCSGITAYAGEGDSGTVIKNETQNEEVVVLRKGNRSISPVPSIQFMDSNDAPLITAPFGDTQQYIYIALRKGESLYHAIVQARFSDGTYTAEESIGDIDSNSGFKQVGDEYKTCTYDEGELVCLGLIGTNSIESNTILYGYSDAPAHHQGTTQITTANGQKFVYDGTAPAKDSPSITFTESKTNAYIDFYEIDGITPVTETGLLGNYYLSLKSYSPNFQIFAPLTISGSKATAGAFHLINQNGNTYSEGDVYYLSLAENDSCTFKLFRYDGVEQNVPEALVAGYDYDGNDPLLTEIKNNGCLEDRYRVSIPNQIGTNGNYYIKATKIPAYTINFSYPENATDSVTGTYYLYVQGQKDDTTYGAVVQVPVSNGKLQSVNITELKNSDSNKISYDSTVTITDVQLYKQNYAPGINNGQVNNTATGAAVNDNVAEGYMYSQPSIGATSSTYNVTLAPTYDVSIKLDANEGDTYTTPHIFATITRGDTTYYAQTTLASLNNGETKTYSFGPFTDANGNPAINYVTTDTVQLYLCDAEITNYNNITGTHSTGDVINNEYVLGIKGRAITLTPIVPCNFSIVSSDGSALVFDTDYTDNWYAIVTIAKDSGGAFQYVESVTLQDETGDSGHCTLLYNRNVHNNVQLSNPSSTDVGVYQDGDLLELQLVHLSSDYNSTPTTYKDIIDPENKTGWESFSDGDVADKYRVSVSSNNNNVTLTLTKLDPLTIKTAFMDGETTVTTPPEGYSLLLKMTDGEGRTYYALQPVNSDTASTNGVSFTDGFQELTYSNSSYSLSEKKTHYTGTETVTAQVVSGTNLTLNTDLARGIATNVTYYDKGNAILSNSDVYRYQGSSLASNVLTATFNKQPNNATAHKINLDFYTAKSDSPSLETTASLGSGHYFLRVRLLDKETTTVDSTGKITVPGKVVAYKYIQLGTPVISNGHFDTTLENTVSYQLVDAGENDVANKTVNYDPTAYVIDVRLYHCKNNGQYPSKLGDANNFGHDTIDGYDFWDNLLDATNQQTNIRLYNAYKKVYQLQVEIDPTASGDLSNLNVKDTVKHQTTGEERYEKNLVSASDTANGITVDTVGGKTVVTYVIEDQTADPIINRWISSDNNFNNNTKNITGNEDFIVSLLNGGTVIQEGYPVQIGSDYYQVSYTKKQTKVDNGDVTTITDYITLKKMDFDSLTYEDVLGPGVYYGIAVDTFHNTGHIQSNIAVNNYYGKGGEINPNLSFAVDDDGNPIAATGVIVAADIKDNRMYLNIGNNDGKALVFVDPDDKQYVTDTAGGRMNGVNYFTIPTDGEQISSGIVDPILHHGSSMSASLLSKETTFAPVPSNNGTVDLTGFPEGATIYIDGDKYASYLAESQGLKFEMNKGQVVVFNFDSTEHITLNKLLMKVNNQELSPEDIAEHVVYNCASATTLNLVGSYGMFLAPREDVDITIMNSSEGWVISNGTLRQHDYGCEWHLKSKKMKRDTTASTSFGKKVDGRAPTSYEVFDFPLYKWSENENGDHADNDWQFVKNLQNVGPSMTHDVKMNEGRIFKIKEVDKNDGLYTYDQNEYYVLIRYAGQVGGPTSIGVAAYAEYYRTFDAAYDIYLHGDAASDESKAAKLPAIVFQNTTIKGGLNISKVVTPETTDDQEFNFELHVWNNTADLTDLDHPVYAYTGEIKGTKGNAAWTATSTTTDSITIGSDTFDTTKTTFKLIAGETLNITSLPVGTCYAITEVTTGLPSYYEFDHITVDGASQTTQPVIGSIASTTTAINVEYTNTYERAAASH